MSTWLRRLSRDRNSKAEPDFQSMNNAAYNNNNRPGSSYNETAAIPPLYKDTQYSNGRRDSQDMMLAAQLPLSQSQPYPPSGGYRRQVPTGDALPSQYSPTRANGATTTTDASMHTAAMMSNVASAPDPLTRAFNEAIKPYVEEIDVLRGEVDAAHSRIQELEQERSEWHAWIDKRGLRPDLTPTLTAYLPSTPLSASTFSNQLERKMTMLNFDLHRLADSLPAPLPTTTISQTLSSLLPSISRLSGLPHGPPLAFELLVKLGGNINSHNTGEESEGDFKSIADFYTRLDEGMVDVIRRRLDGLHGGEAGEAGEGGMVNGTTGEGDRGWAIERDVKRLEKTGGFLRKEMGLMNYFVRSLDVLRYEVKRGTTAADGGRYTP